MESKTVLLVLCLAIATCLIVERVEATFGWLKNGGGGKQEFLRRISEDRPEWRNRDWYAESKRAKMRRRQREQEEISGRN